MDDVVRAIVRKIDPEARDIKGTFVDEFVRDCIRNEGKVVILHDYHEDDGECRYQVKSDGNALWHQDGRGEGKNAWRGGEDIDVTNQIFRIVKTKPIKLDEDLFKL